MKVRIKFSKLGSLRYVGHLDFMRAVQKMIRRSAIEAAYTKGFSPHHILSFASPLGVGLESTGEYFDLELAYRDPFDMSQVDLSRLNSIGLDNDALPDVPASEWILEQLNAQTPEGVSFLGIRRVEENNNKAMALVRAADYTLFMENRTLAGLDPDRLLTGFLARKKIMFHKVSRKTESDVDIRPLIYAARIADENHSLFTKDPSGSDTDLSSNEQTRLASETSRRIRSEGYPIAVDLKLSAGSAANLKPETVAEALCTHAQIPYDPFACRVLRREMYMEGGKTLLNDGIRF